MKHLHFLPILLLVVAAIATGCHKDDEFRSASIARPESGLLLVSGEGGLDSLVLITTESFTITTTVPTAGETNTWYSFPDEFTSFTNNMNHAIIQFNIPITFQRNESDHQRTVVFNVNAGDYSVACAFVQDTLHTATNSEPSAEPANE